jgi:hypothetical protein
VYPRVDRDPELCADAIRAAHEQWVGVACCLEVEDATETTDLGVGTRTPRCAHVGLDHLDECISFIDRDPCLCIGEAWSGFSNWLQPSL